MYCVVSCPKGHMSIALLSSKTHSCPVCGTVFMVTPKRKRRVQFSSHDAEACRRYMLKQRASWPHFVAPHVSKTQ
jgi:ssDNA-binding Zn-finger/Zn-ribbon topoisomerase 1